MSFSIERRTMFPELRQESLAQYLALCWFRQVCRHRSSYRCWGDKFRDGPCLAFLSHLRTFSENLVQIQYWRQLPYCVWCERAGGSIVFDRNYCPLVRIPTDGRCTLVKPSERIDFWAADFLYTDSSSPYIDPDTLPMMLFLADGLGLRQEIAYRWELSDFSRIDCRDWTPNWRTP